MAVSEYNYIDLSDRVRISSALNILPNEFMDTSNLVLSQPAVHENRMLVCAY